MSMCREVQNENAEDNTLSLFREGNRVNRRAVLGLGHNATSVIGFAQPRHL